MVKPEVKSGGKWMRVNGLVLGNESTVLAAAAGFGARFGIIRRENLYDHVMILAVAVRETNSQQQTVDAPSRSLQSIAKCAAAQLLQCKLQRDTCTGIF
eukprot:SAG11_NODE_668_length_7841_cov_10.134461_8_plen_99_part_00